MRQRRKQAAQRLPNDDSIDARRAVLPRRRLTGAYMRQHGLVDIIQQFFSFIYPFSQTFLKKIFLLPSFASAAYHRPVVCPLIFKYKPMPHIITAVSTTGKASHTPVIPYKFDKIKTAGMIRMIPRNMEMACANPFF